MTRFIYLVEARNAVVKIGSTSNVSERVQTIRTHSPEAIRLIALWTGGITDEKALHREFDAHRYHCEWFRLEGAFAEFVDSVRGRGLDRVQNWEEVMHPLCASRRERYRQRALMSWAERHSAAKRPAPPPPSEGARP